MPRTGEKGPVAGTALGPLILHDQHMVAQLRWGFPRYGALPDEDRAWLRDLGGALARKGYSLQFWHVAADYSVILVYRGDGTRVGQCGQVLGLRTWLDGLPDISATPRETGAQELT